MRFPLNQNFDGTWDEHLLGDDIMPDYRINRVVQLGFEFPDSNIIGRRKSKIYKNNQNTDINGLCTSKSERLIY